MLLAHPLIAPASWTLTGGAWLTDSAALCDRSPAAAARFTWPDGDQTTATTATLTADFGEQAVGALALLATTLPAGAKVELRGKRAVDSDYTYALGGGALTQRLAVFPDGTVGGVWIFGDDIDALTGLQITLYNDVDGVAALVAAAAYDIGEIAAGTVVTIPHQTGWTDDGVDPSTSTRTLGSQSNRVARPGYRKITVTPVYASAAEARAGGLSDGSDWTTLAARLRHDPYALAIVEPAAAQATTIFGPVTRVPKRDSLAGPYYQPSQLTIEEVRG